MKKTIPPGNAVNSFEGIFPGVRIDNASVMFVTKTVSTKVFSLTKNWLEPKDINELYTWRGHICIKMNTCGHFRILKIVLGLTHVERGTKFSAL